MKPGAVMIVGGSIDNFSRVMTTSIALEIPNGTLTPAVGLGLVLIAITMAINALARGVRRWWERYAG